MHKLEKPQIKQTTVSVTHLYDTVCHKKWNCATGSKQWRQKCKLHTALSMFTLSKYDLHLYFNGNFPGEPGLAGSPRFTSSTRSGKRIFGDKRHRYGCHSCHPTKCQNTKGNLKHWQPVAWPHPFTIHHQTTERKGIAPFTPAFWHKWILTKGNTTWLMTSVLWMRLKCQH